MSKLRLSLSCTENERTSALLNGLVEATGLDLICVKRREGADHLVRQLKYREFDVSEMSINFYWLARSYTDFPFVAIPVFPQPANFFHTRIRYSVGSGIKQPADLRGKRFGLPFYLMDVMLWIRGVLEHEYGIKYSEMKWFAERPPVIEEIFGIKQPSYVFQIPQDKSIASMMKSGELDACFPYPDKFRTSMERSTDEDLRTDPKISLLYPDQVQESVRYYKKTGLFHLNHLMIVRKSVLDENPWVAQSLVEAFKKSKEMGYEKTWKSAAFPDSTMWSYVIMEKAREVFGDYPFPFGFKANVHLLKTHAQYSYEQELVPKEIRVEELFAQNTLDT